MCGFTPIQVYAIHIGGHHKQIRLQFTGQQLADQVFVDHLYDAAFNRDPDERGLGYWVSQLAQNKVDLSGVAKAFLESAEFADIYGHDLPDSEFIEALYHNVLGRDSDEAGYHFWMGQLVSGVARYDVLEAFALSLENTQGETGSEVEVTGAIDSGEALL